MNTSEPTAPTARSPGIVSRSCGLPRQAKGGRAHHAAGVVARIDRAACRMPAGPGLR